MQQRQGLIFIFILVFSLGWVFLSADREGVSTGGLIPAPRQGFLAPDFTLENLAGETITLSSLRGQVVLVNFWATWCPPCKAEMPAIQEMHARYREQGLVILAVNATRQDSLSLLAPFAQEYALSFPILLDVTGEVERLYQVNALPTTFFIDRNGIIQKVVVGGPMSEALLETTIEGLLR